MEIHPLVADMVAEVEAVLEEEPALSVAEVALVLQPKLAAFMAEARGPGATRPLLRLADRAPLERAFLTHPAWEEFCRRYGDGIVALRDGDWD